MSGVPLERDQRYRVVLEALVTENGATFARYRADTGLRGQGAEPAGPSFLVVLQECCSVQVALGENGLTLQRVRLAAAERAVITATVQAGAEAPEWLPAESTYLLFDGDRTAAAAAGERYIPFEGLLHESGAPCSQSTTLEQLAIAAGRSVARANAALAQTVTPAGVALVSGLTIQVAVSQAEVCQGRLLIAGVPPGGQSQAPVQFVQLTLTTVPGAEMATISAAPAGTAAAPETTSLPSGLPTPRPPTPPEALTATFAGSPLSVAPPAGVVSPFSLATPPSLGGPMAGGSDATVATATVRPSVGKSRPVRASQRPKTGDGSPGAAVLFHGKGTGKK
ncbi:MAG: hypothetical protein ACM3XM_16630 [Mycobacterium leprae]